MQRSNGHMAVKLAALLNGPAQDGQVRGGNAQIGAGHAAILAAHGAETLGKGLHGGICAQRFAALGKHFPPGHTGVRHMDHIPFLIDIISAAGFALGLGVLLGFGFVQLLLQVRDLLLQRFDGRRIFLGLRVQFGHRLLHRLKILLGGRLLDGLLQLYLPGIQLGGLVPQLLQGGALDGLLLPQLQNFQCHDDHSPFNLFIRPAFLVSSCRRLIS